ncbi:MAG TPA: hypothetical protein PLE82_05865 [Saccharofermentans sp.]|nr:hypothetical protein [Saccharofermentans sp.]
MAASRQTIMDWFNGSYIENATHMIVVCDEYDWDDYPVYVSAEQDVREVEAEYRAKPMQRVMEVYKLSMSLDEQMAQHRAFNY